jgi:multiple sugar transport system substrate-binding protein
MTEPAAAAARALVAGLHEQAHGGEHSRTGGGTMQVRTVALAAALMLAPLAARAADLVLWWEEGFNAEEDVAVHEMMTDFERKTGKTVELAFFPQDVLANSLETALAAGEPPDFEFGARTSWWMPQWAQEDRLVELSAALGPLTGIIDPDALAWSMLSNGSTGRTGLYSLPMARATHHVHVWKSLLEQAGFGLADIPKDWEGFWSFWCEKVQPAVRKALGRDDIWGLGLPMSAEANDTATGLAQFAGARTRDWPGPSGTSLADDPTAQAALVKALSEYTTLYKRGCTPPQSVAWDNLGNNEAFVAQTIVMTINSSLSITAAIRRERPADYVSNVVTIDWPNDAFGKLLHLEAALNGGAVFAAGHNTETALEFVRFLVGEGWLAHWLNFAGDRYVPVLATLTDQPFWLDPGNPHRMQSVMQSIIYPQNYNWWGLPNAQRHYAEDYPTALGKAVHRVVTDGLTPEQAADEAIVRIKQLLSE